MMQTMTQMTFREAVAVLEEFVDRFVWLATPAHGTLPDKAGEALSFLKKADLPLTLRSLEQEAISTGSVQPVLRVLELLKFELLILSLEDIKLFAPRESEARKLTERILAHLHAVRQILNPYYEAQEVE